MDLVKLEYFIVVAEMENMTKAAESLFISQPALSSAISKLEQELGYPLFLRQGRGIVLNEYGRLLLEYAKVIVRNWNSLKGALDQLALESSPSVSIGITSPVLVNEIISDFSEKCPDESINQYQLRVDDLRTPAKYALLDFILSTMPIDNPGWANIPLQEERFVMGVSANHPLAAQERISLSDFQDETFFVFSDESVSEVEINAIFEKADFKPRRIRKILRNQLDAQVAKGYGVCLYGETSSYQRPVHDGIRFLQISNPDCFRTLYLIKRKKEHENAVAKQFYKHVMSYQDFHFSNSHQTT